MADNPYDSSSSQVSPVAQPIPGGASDSPFSFGGDPNQQGMLGMSRGFWRDIASLGANMVTSANARTSGGFLANGTGFMGPFGAAVGETLAQGQKNATAQAALNQSSAVTQGQTLTNQKTALELQLQRAKNPWIIEQYQNGGLIDNGTGLTGGGSSNGAGANTGKPTAGVNVPPEVSGAIKSLEGGSSTASKTGLNQLGYAGNYQMGAAALADAGLYQPAKGEDLSKNQWQGKITVPGFDPMGVQDFINNPQAQDAAFSIHMGNLSNRAHNLGLDSYIGQTVGGVAVTPETIAAMEHFAGPAGTLRYLQSGGTFNPKDANGMHVSDYANRVTAALGTGYKSPPNWFVRTAAATQGQPEASGATSGSDDTGTTSVGSSGSYQVTQAGGAVPTPNGSGSATPSHGAAGAPQVAADVNAITAGMHGSQTPQPQGAVVAQNGGTNPYAVSPNQTIAPQAPPGYMTAQQAMQRSAYLRTLAQRQALAGLTEMSTQTNQAAQQLEQYGQQTMLQQSTAAQTQVLERTKPQTIRGPGAGVVIPGVNGAPDTIIQSPTDKGETIGPDGRKWNIVRDNIPDPNKPYVRPAGVPDWTPEGTIAAWPEGLSKAQEKAAEEFWSETQTKQQNAAIGTIGWTQTMQSNFDSLNKTGDAWSKTGPSAEIRMGMASHVNDVFRFMGLGEPFNVTKLENWEELEKQTKVAGMQLVNSFFGGQREAASIIQSAMGAVPSSKNSPLGAVGLMNVIREVAQYQVDKRHFITETAQHNGGDYALPADQFDPNGTKIKQYMTRATSQTAPIAVKSSTPEDFQKTEASRFLPGTMIRLPNGRTLTVPYPNAGQ